MEIIRKFDALSSIVVIVLFAADIFLLHSVLGTAPLHGAHTYFLDVGQGDSELIIFPGNIKMLTDAGPDNKVLASLAAALPVGDMYIDLALISYPAIDHFGGFNYILDHYIIGAFLYNGRDAYPSSGAWLSLLAKIKQKHISIITIGRGDSIHFGDNAINIMSPDAEFDRSPDLKDTGLVEFIKTVGMTMLLTADIGANVENYLLQAGMKTGTSLTTDILKVPDHGSRYSLVDLFLKAIYPKATVIEVGAHSAVASSTGAHSYRTDQNGTVEIWPENGVLRVRKEK